MHDIYPKKQLERGAERLSSFSRELTCVNLPLGADNTIILAWISMRKKDVKQYVG